MHNKRVFLYTKRFDSDVVSELGLSNVIIGRLKFLELIFNASAHIIFVGGLEGLYVLSLLGRKRLYLSDHHPITCKPLNTERGYLQRRICSDPILSLWNEFNRHYEYSNFWNMLRISWLVRHLVNKQIYKACTSIVLSDMAVYEKEYLYNTASIKLVPSNFSIQKNASQKERLILVISRLEKSKRVEFLLDAFLKSRLYELGYVCKVLGTGELETSLKLKYECERQIAFLGYVSESEKVECLQKAQVVLNGQVADFNLIQIEARSYQCAYISPGMQNDLELLTYLPKDSSYLIHLLENYKISDYNGTNEDYRIQYLLDKCY